VTFVFGGYTLKVLFKNEASLLSFCAVTLAGLAVFQTVSGALLAILSPSVTALSLCDNLALYLTPLIALELLIASRMNRAGIPLPFSKTIAPVMGSVVAFCLLVVVGV
jgi:hypothetical protein